MHAIGANALRQFWICGDQQNQRARTANAPEPPRDIHAIGRAKMAINHGRATRQAFGDLNRIGRSGWIAQEIQRRNGRSAGVAVEPARERG